MAANAVQFYNDLYEACTYPPLYAAPWWLNATCGSGGWNAIPLKNEDGNISAIIPFYNTHIRGLSAVITPPLTQWLPVLTSSQVNGFSLPEFLQSLPSSSILDITIKPGEIPVLPGSSFHVNFRYSYIIPYHAANDHFKLKYNEGLRRNLKEASLNYSISDSDDMPTFLRLCESSYRLRKMKPPPWLDQIIPIVADALTKRHSGKINLAFYKGEAIAGILIGWDSDTTYYLLGGRHGDEQGASAHALLLDRAISAAQQRGHKFDFEGSMHSGIANFFQSFGATPEEYWQIRNTRELEKSGHYGIDSKLKHLF